MYFEHKFLLKVLYRERFYLARNLNSGWRFLVHKMEKSLVIGVHFSSGLRIRRIAQLIFITFL